MLFNLEKSLNSQAVAISYLNTYQMLATLNASEETLKLTFDSSTDAYKQAIRTADLRYREDLEFIEKLKGVDNLQDRNMIVYKLNELNNEASEKLAIDINKAELVRDIFRTISYIINGFMILILFWVELIRK